MSKHWIREFFEDWHRWCWGTAVWNLRFNLGLWVGGFTSARRRVD